MNDLNSLINECKKGNRKAQQALFDQMKNRWMGISIRYVKDSDEAKDVFQEAALKIFTDLRSLKDSNAFAGWARKIVVHTALNHLKKKQSYLFALQENHAREDGGINRSDEEIILRMDNEKLMAIINEMPEGYRTVFNLFMVDGYSHQEIAATLNITEGTSRSQLTKAKQYLKRILETLKKTSHERVVGL